MVVVRKGLRGLGNRELLLNGYRASVLQDEKSSGDSGDDCTIA